MAWIIMNESRNTVVIGDLGIVIRPRQTVDLDVVGREIAERSSGVCDALKICSEIRKDPPPGSDQTSGEAAIKFNAAAEQITQTVQQAQQVMADAQETIKQQAEAVATAQAQQESFASILEEMRQMAANWPEEMHGIKTALENIRSERMLIADRIASLPDSGASEAEIQAQERILSKRSERLEKNMEKLGETIKVDGGDIDDALAALDELDI